VFQPKILLPSTINIPSLQNEKRQEKIRTYHLNDTTGHVEREREQVDRPEIDWTQCLSPRGTPDDPMTKMQTSTEQKQQSARGKMR
jgi:hypothetical protein